MSFWPRSTGRNTVLLLIIGVFLLPACQSSPQTTLPQATTVAETASMVEASDEAPTAAPTMAVMASSPESSNTDDVVDETGPLPVVASPTPVVEELPTPTPTPTTPAPKPVKEGLEATDPASVELASGNVQLVEFFAFW